MKPFDVYGGMFLSSVSLAVMVVAAELLPVFKTSVLAAIGGLVTFGAFVHHWPGKLVLLIALFLIGGYFLPRSEKQAWYATLGSFAVILLFFIVHYMV